MAQPPPNPNQAVRLSAEVAAEVAASTTVRHRRHHHFVPAISTQEDNKSNTLHTTLHGSIPPVLYVNQNELIQVETVDCYGGHITPSQPDTTQLTRSQLNPVTGPIYINDAHPGDWIAVTLHHIRPNSSHRSSKIKDRNSSNEDDTKTDYQPSFGVACCNIHSGQLSHRVLSNNKRYKDEDGDGDDDGDNALLCQTCEMTTTSSSSGTPSPSSATSTTRFFEITYDDDDNDVNGNNDHKGVSTTKIPTVSGTVTMVEDHEDDDAINNSDNSSNNSSRKRQRRICPISFPLRPMLGVIAVAPPPSISPISTMPAGVHGGNLDNKMNGIGSTIYLRVFHNGALLFVGDMHASQGDGEISGTGVEVGGRVLLSCRIISHNDINLDPITTITNTTTTTTATTSELSSSRSIVATNSSSASDVNGTTVSKNHNPDDDVDVTESNADGMTSIIHYPVTETSTHWMTHGVVVEDIPKATVVACEEAATLLVTQWGFTYEEAFIFLSVRGDLGVCQSCHPDTGTQIVRMMVEKLPVCPRPFRCLLDGK